MTTMTKYNNSNNNRNGNDTNNINGCIENKKTNNNNKEENKEKSTAAEAVNSFKRKLLHQPPTEANLAAAFHSACASLSTMVLLYSG